MATRLPRDRACTGVGAFLEPPFNGAFTTHACPRRARRVVKIRGLGETPLPGSGGRRRRSFFKNPVLWRLPHPRTGHATSGAARIRPREGAPVPRDDSAKGGRTAGDTAIAPTGATCRAPHVPIPHSRQRDSPSVVAAVSARRARACSPMTAPHRRRHSRKHERCIAAPRAAMRALSAGFPENPTTGDHAGDAGHRDAAAQHARAVAACAIATVPSRPSSHADARLGTRHSPRSASRRSGTGQPRLPAGAAERRKQGRRAFPP